MGRGDIDVKDLRLKQVYPSSNDSLDDRKIDIVLIHGKAAHPYRTWTKQREGSSSTHKKDFLDWTTHKDWLPSAIPDARIFRFGYRGDWYGKDAIKTRTSSISTSLLDQISSVRWDCVNRPLLFIAHSYGGLVLAKALAYAWHNQTRWPDIYAATVGAVFLGTPFRGTTHLLHLAILPQIESTSEYVLRDNIESSKADKDWLHDMFSDFCKSIRESAEDDGKAPSIACFFEREPTDLSFYLRNSAIAEREVTSNVNKYRDIVVSESSACLDHLSSTLDIRRFSRACDHLNLHRFTDLEQQEWITFKEVLEDFAKIQTRLSKSYREKLIASLRYENMDHRRTLISEPCAGTYTWIHETPVHDRREWHRFDEWLRGNDPIYWISGRAGSGKSVLLAHIVGDEKTLKGLKSWSGRAHLQLLSFFFWKPGSGLENNVQGLLQSFLYQLCNYQPAVVTAEMVNELGLQNQQVPSWTVAQLTRVLRAVLKATGTTRRCCVFIDGLDEFTGDQLDLLDFITSLRHFGNVKCCVSSRPEQTFEKALHSFPRMKLEALNDRDISSFVESAFRRADAANEDELMMDICRRAEGVFLWAALVTKDVLRGLEAHDDSRVLKSRIEKLPLDLIQLYRKMLENVDQEHRDCLAFYVQCLRAPIPFWEEAFSLFTSISVLTAERLQDVPSSYKDFAAECEKTKVQIMARTGGLLEIREAAESTCEHWEKAENEWIVAQDIGAGKAWVGKRQLTQPDHYVSALYLEAQQLEWVHRSAYDFVFEFATAQELIVPDLQEVSARLWRAALAYVWIAPSVYLPPHLCPHDKTLYQRPARAYRDSVRQPGCAHDLDKYTVRCNLWGMLLRVRHGCTSTMLRIKAMLRLAYDTDNISRIQLSELFEVSANLDVDEFGFVSLVDVGGAHSGELIYNISLVLREPGTLMFWVLCAYFCLPSFYRSLSPLTETQNMSLAWFLFAHINTGVAHIESVKSTDRFQNFYHWIEQIPDIMRCFNSLLARWSVSKKPGERIVTTSSPELNDAARAARRMTPTPGYGVNHEIGLRFRTFASSIKDHGLEGMFCAAIGSTWWTWSQLQLLDPDIRQGCDEISDLFNEFNMVLDFSYMSPHCPGLYLTPRLDAEINDDVDQITWNPDTEQCLTIAQAVASLDVTEAELVSPIKKQNSEEDIFWEITSESTKRAAITAEYEMRVMAWPARQAGKSLEDFWGPESDELAAYRAARDRYREFIDRAFDEDIEQKRIESEALSSQSSANLPRKRVRLSD